MSADRSGNTSFLLIRRISLQTLKKIYTGYLELRLKTCEIGNSMKCFLPNFALLPAASKIQVQTILRFSIDRSQSFGGHQVSKTATLTSLLLTWSIPESKTQTGFNRTTIPWQHTFRWRNYHPKQSLSFHTCFSFVCSSTSYLAFHS